MKLTVIGASRGVGRSLTEQAITAGHEVTTLTRQPVSFEAGVGSLRSIIGDATDRASVAKAVKGQDVVFCTLGADAKGPTKLYSDAAATLVETMRDESAKLVFLSNFGVLGESGAGIKTRVLLWLIKRMLHDTLDDHRRALEILRQSSLNWVAIRPMLLKDGSLTRVYRVAREGVPRGGTKISRPDVAHFMLAQATEQTFDRTAPAIAY